MAQSRAMSKSRHIDLLIEAGRDIDANEYQNNPERINKLLSAGVDYKDKKKRVWVANGHVCYAIYARALDIADGDNSSRWQWSTDSDNIEMAKAVKIKLLEVEGSFCTHTLSLDVTYKVSFQLRIDPTQYKTMKGQNVNLTLTLPDGSEQTRKAALPGKKVPGTDPWYELEVGEIDMTAENVGDMKFTMNKDFGEWSGGLVIKSVQIKTK